LAASGRVTSANALTTYSIVIYLGYLKILAFALRASRLPFEAVTPPAAGSWFTQVIAFRVDGIPLGPNDSEELAVGLQALLRERAVNTLVPIKALPGWAGLFRLGAKGGFGSFFLYAIPFAVTFLVGFTLGFAVFLFHLWGSHSVFPITDEGHAGVSIAKIAQAKFRFLDKCLAA
jgi:hypothetical protein